MTDRQCPVYVAQAWASGLLEAIVAAVAAALAGVVGVSVGLFVPEPDCAAAPVRGSIEQAWHTH